MSAQGKKRGPKSKLWKHSKPGKVFASMVLHFKFEPRPGHPVRTHIDAIRKVLQKRSFAYLKQRYLNLDAADPKLRRKAERYLEKKFQECLPSLEAAPQSNQEKNRGTDS